LVAKDLGYMPLSDFQRMDSLLAEVRKMLWSLIVTVAAAERAASDLKLRT
jgi:hypothetical protein